MRVTFKVQIICILHLCVGTYIDIFFEDQVVDELILFKQSDCTNADIFSEMFTSECNAIPQRNAMMVIILRLLTAISRAKIRLPGLTSA